MSSMKGRLVRLLGGEACGAGPSPRCKTWAGFGVLSCSATSGALWRAPRCSCFCLRMICGRTRRFPMRRAFRSWAGSTRAGRGALAFECAGRRCAVVSGAAAVAGARRGAGAAGRR